MPLSVQSAQRLADSAKALAQRFLIMDMHVDVPYRLRETWADISQRTEDGHFDFPRAKAGGLNAPFMSIYIPASYQETGGAKELADSLIDMVEKFAADWPDKFAVARSIADVKAAFKKGLIALPMGMENGAAIEGKLEYLEHFYNRGIRYITLTHSKNNHICDSSYDTEDRWKGLSPFGEDLIAAMNDIGMLIDISHVDDSTFWQVLERSKAPVLATHSSCRHFTPGWERNMSDDMIKALAEKDGVICINFGASFINGTFQKHMSAVYNQMEADHIDWHSPEGKATIEKALAESNLREVTVQAVADHIDHVKDLVGIDHIGLGSDFDGVSALPVGLGDASTYPNLIEELLKRGYTESEISRICSGNVIRLWSKVDEVAGR